LESGNPDYQPGLATSFQLVRLVGCGLKPLPKHWKVDPEGNQRRISGVGFGRSINTCMVMPILHSSYCGGGPIYTVLHCIFQNIDTNHHCEVCKQMLCNFYWILLNFT